MGLFGWFSERKARREEEERAYYEEQERLRREEERQARSQGGPPEDVVIKTELGFTVMGMLYKVRITNDSQDPMGDVDVTVVVDKKIGIPVKKSQNIDMLDPDETVVLEFDIVPVLNLGKGTVKSQVSYFDFSEQNRVTFNLKSRSVQIACPKLQPMKVDDDLWRIRMTNLEKFEYESVEVSGVPADLFQELCQSTEAIGFFGTDPFVVPTLFRGIGKFMGTVGEDIYACQVQVIGQEDVSKILLECYGPTIEKAAGIAARIITPLDNTYHLKKHIRSELDPMDLKGMVETSESAKFDASEAKILGADQKPLVQDKQVVRKKRTTKPDSRPKPGWTPPEEEKPKEEVWEPQTEDTAPKGAPVPAAAEPPAAEQKEDLTGTKQVVRKLRIVAD